ncbi:hypothetical protein [Aquimarina longa]|uniref:hypothetical protein n=1 Tax=Aquimarina longa TaxID=1080221 RepID=UPI0007842C8A|nr:hypothetical protein [Aquimarina longa]
MKKIVFTALTIASIAFTGCSGDDDVALNPNGGGDNNGGGTKGDGIITSVSDEDFKPSDLKGDVTGNIKLVAGTKYKLTGPLKIKKGATLEIEAGTKIEASAGGSDVFIAVERDAKIEANGTAAAPIVFTSAAANPRSGDWGGIVIAGKAPANVGVDVQTEVAGLKYGGTESADNSGTLSYVVAEYTGARIDGTQEFNGISLFGVGSGTTINNIVVKNGDDDGIEFFGGTVNVTNIMIINAKDDMFDYTSGWVGTADNILLIREKEFTAVTKDPRGIEGDGNENNNAATPLSNPTIKNITIINDALKTTEMSDMIKIRRGSKATITNAVIALGTKNKSRADDFIDLEDKKGNANAAVAITVRGINIDETDIKNAPGATITIDATTTGADLSKFAFSNYDFTVVNAILNTKK